MIKENIVSEVVSGVQDFKVELSLDELGVAIYETPVIDGELEWVLLRTQQQCLISITSTLFEDFAILEDYELKKDVLLPIRIQPVDTKGRNLSFGVESIKLRESLKVRVMGVANTRVLCWFRWC